MFYRMNQRETFCFPHRETAASGDACGQFFNAGTGKIKQPEPRKVPGVPGQRAERRSGSLEHLKRRERCYRAGKLADRRSLHLKPPQTGKRPDIFREAGAEGVRQAEFGEAGKALDKRREDTGIDCNAFPSSRTRG